MMATQLGRNVERGRVSPELALVDADDPVVGDLLEAMLEVLAEAGGWLHPAARLVCRAGNLSLHCSGPIGEPLVRIPHEVMVPVGRIRWSTEGSQLAFEELPESLDDTASEMAYLQVALLNQCRKLPDLQHTHPLLAPLAPGVIEAVRAFRPSFRARPIDPVSLLWSTRCFRLRTADRPAEPVSIPVVDLLDHHRQGASGTGNLNAFDVPISRPLDSDACFLDYGWQRDPIGMAIVYGFADESAEVAHSAPLRIRSGTQTIEVEGTGRDADGHLVAMRAQASASLVRISHVSLGPTQNPVAELIAAAGLDATRARQVIEDVAAANLELLERLASLAVVEPGQAASTLAAAARKQQTLIRSGPLTLPQ